MGRVNTRRPLPSTPCCLRSQGTQILPQHGLARVLAGHAFDVSDDSVGTALVLHLPQKHHLPLWVARLFRDVALQALELVECVAR